MKKFVANSKTKLIKCDFCQYRAGKNTCTVIPDSSYCYQAQNEFYEYLKNLKNKK